MNRNELKLRVESECPEALRAYIGRGFSVLGEDFLPRDKNYMARDVGMTIQLIGRLATELARRSQVEDSTVVKLNRLDMLTSDNLAKKIEPWLWAVREELFGSAKPPFGRYEDAIAWLSGQEHKTAGRVNLLPYPAPTGWLKHVRVPEDSESPLWCLSYETQQMAGATGFSQPALVMYVLVDTKPLLPRWIIKPQPHFEKVPAEGTFAAFYKGARDAIHDSRPEPPKHNMWRSSVIVEFKGRDLTFEELQEIYKTVRSMLHVRKKKSLKQKHLELYGLVHGKGGPPIGKGTVAFWKKVQKEWNRRHRESEYHSWKGLQRAYNAVLDKVEQST